MSSTQHAQPYPLDEIIQQSPGFHGIFTETGREGSQSIHSHMVCVSVSARACVPSIQSAWLSTSEAVPDSFSPMTTLCLLLRTSALWAREPARGHRKRCIRRLYAFGELH